MMRMIIVTVVATFFKVFVVRKMTISVGVFELVKAWCGLGHG